MKMWLIIPLVIALIIAIGAISLLFKSSKWPSVTANIISVDIIEIYHSPNSAITNHKNTHSYEIDIHYQYVVEGTTYIGNKLYAGLPNILSTQLEAENVLHQFPRNAVVTVYYNPHNPEASALLLPTAKGGNKLLLILIGLVFAGFIGATAIIIPKI